LGSSSIPARPNFMHSQGMQHGPLDRYAKYDDFCSPEYESYPQGLVVNSSYPQGLVVNSSYPWKPPTHSLYPWRPPTHELYSRRTLGHGSFPWGAITPTSRPHPSSGQQGPYYLEEGMYSQPLNSSEARDQYSTWPPLQLEENNPTLEV